MSQIVLLLQIIALLQAQIAFLQQDTPIATTTPIAIVQPLGIATSSPEFGSVSTSSSTTTTPIIVPKSGCWNDGVTYVGGRARYQQDIVCGG